MEAKWWKEAVVYQIYPKSFKDSNGDGIGDLKGIMEKLPYLKDLGIDAVWICPFYKSPMKDNGYDISDYYDIEEMFGSIEDMEALLALAKSYDIKILIDLVLNHSSDQHEWFKEALRDPKSRYRDYYIFRKGMNGKPPTNWRSNFGGSVWEPVEEDVYYLHSFAKEQPDLNWENPEVRQALYDMINFWLEKGVAGFRIDAITFIKKDQRFTSLESDDRDGLVGLAKVSQNQPGIDEFLKELKENTYGITNSMTVAEAPGVPYDQLDKYIGEDGHFSMIFDFSYNDIDLPESGNWYEKKEWSITDLRDAIFKSQLSIQKVGWGALYLENHDQPRSLNKYVKAEEIGYHSSSALATMYFFLRGTPFIYQGQEIGMTNRRFRSIEEFDDVATKDQFQRAIAAGLSEEEALAAVNKRSRDNSRTPMQWDDSENGGFTTGKPWLEVNSNYREINIEAQQVSQNSLLQYYKELIKLRKESSFKEVLTYGDIETTLLEYENIIAYKRKFKGKEILVITHLANAIVELEVDYKNVILDNYNTIYRKDNHIVLRGYESIVLEM